MEMSELDPEAMEEISGGFSLSSSFHNQGKMLMQIRKMQGIGKSADEIATEICSHAIGLGYILPGSDADPKVLADFIHMYYDAISGNT